MKIFLAIFGLTIGIIGAIFLPNYFLKNPPGKGSLIPEMLFQKTEVMGFMPYWLIEDTNKDYSSYLNTISYFSVTVDSDGSIEKFTVPTESEPGWLALQSGKIDSTLDAAKRRNMKRSLVVFSSDQDKIGQLMDNPVEHGQKLVQEVSPLLNQYGFTDLNLDIEHVTDASESARMNFTLFTKTVHDQLRKTNSSVTVSIDASPIVLFRKYLIDLIAVSPYVNKIILMTYDFHYPGSSVTGAVSPVGGAGITAEFDTEVSIKEALKSIKSDKLILGAPLYGYEWETLADYPHAAVIPGTGITISNKRVEDFLATCATCSAQFDPVSQESHVIYKDQDTDTYHQFFYPDKQSMQVKVDLVKKYHLGGIALWALGYEGSDLLEPLKELH